MGKSLARRRRGSASGGKTFASIGKSLASRRRGSGSMGKTLASVGKSSASRRRRSASMGKTLGSIGQGSASTGRTAEGPLQTSVLALRFVRRPLQASERSLQGLALAGKVYSRDAPRRIPPLPKKQPSGNHAKSLGRKCNVSRITTEVPPLSIRGSGHRVRRRREADGPPHVSVGARWVGLEKKEAHHVESHHHEAGRRSPLASQSQVGRKLLDDVGRHLLVGVAMPRSAGVACGVASAVGAHERRQSCEYVLVFGKEAAAVALKSSTKALTTLDFTSVKTALSTYETAVSGLAGGSASIITKAGLIVRETKAPTAALGVVAVVHTKPGEAIGGSDRELAGCAWRNRLRARSVLHAPGHADDVDVARVGLEPTPDREGAARRRAVPRPRRRCRQRRYGVGLERRRVGDCALS